MDGLENTKIVSVVVDDDIRLLKEGSTNPILCVISGSAEWKVIPSSVGIPISRVGNCWILKL